MWHSAYNLTVRPDSDTSPKELYVQNNMGYQLPDFKLTATSSSGGTVTLTPPTTLKVANTLLPGEKGVWKITAGNPAKIEDLTFSVAFGLDFAGWTTQDACYPLVGAKPVMVVVGHRRRRDQDLLQGHREHDLPSCVRGHSPRPRTQPRRHGNRGGICGSRRLGCWQRQRSQDGARLAARRAARALLLAAASSPTSSWRCRSTSRRVSAPRRRQGASGCCAAQPRTRPRCADARSSPAS
jgi:hypothetical protein